MGLEIRSLSKVRVHSMCISWRQMLILLVYHCFFDDHWLGSMVYVVIWRTFLMLEPLKSSLNKPCRSQRIITTSKGLPDVKRANKFILGKIGTFPNKRDVLDLVFGRRESELAFGTVVHHHESIGSHRLNIWAVYHLSEVSFRAQSVDLISQIVIHDLALVSILNLYIDALKCLHNLQFFVMRHSLSEGLKFFKVNKVIFLSTFPFNCICLCLCYFRS